MHNNDSQFSGGKRDSWMIPKIGGLLLAILVGGSGCDKPKPQDVFQTILPAVITNTLDVPGNHSPLFAQLTQPPQLLPWKVHIDCSASMQGFLQHSGGVFQKELEWMNEGLLGKAVFVQAGNTTVTNQGRNFIEFLRKEYYTQPDVDYTNIFQSFAADTNHNHIFVTDGVFVHGRRLVQAADVSESLRQLLSSGGQFVLFAVRAGYNGRCVSYERIKEIPPFADPKLAEVEYQANERPFLVWAFIHYGQTFDDLMRRLKRDREVVEFGERAAQASGTDGTSAKPGPAWEIVVPPSAADSHRVHLAKAEKSGSESATLSKIKELSLPECAYAPCNKLNISGREKFGYRFTVNLPASLIERGVSNTPPRLALGWTNQLLVQWHCWELDPTDWGKPKRMPKLDFTKIWTAPAALSTESPTASLEIAQPRPATSGPYFAWLLTLQLDPPPALLKRWGELSTSDDSAPSSANRIYKFDAFLRSIYDNCQVLDRMFLITEWTQ